MTFSWHPRKSWLWDKSKNCIFGSRTGSCFSYGLQCNLLLLLTTLGYLEYLCFSLRPIFFNPCCALESSLVEASGSAGKESACHAGDTGDVVSTPGSERSPEGGHGDPLQCSCLENPMDIVAWRATVHEVTTSLTWLGDWTHSGVLEKKKKRPMFSSEYSTPWRCRLVGSGVRQRDPGAHLRWDWVPDFFGSLQGS